MGIGKNLKIILDNKGMTVAELARLSGIAPQTLYAIIKRDNDKVSMDALLLISKVLDMPIEKIADLNCESPNGYKTKKTDLNINKRDERDIARRLEETLSELEQGQDGLMFSGDPLDEETRELLKISLENSLKIAKINAKEKFTPKKYKGKNLEKL